MCGVNFNRGRIICSILFIPIMVLFFFADKILIALAQDPYISKISRDYVVYSIPGLYAITQFDSRKRYLQSMQYSFVSTYSQMLSCVLHVFWCMLFIGKLEMGWFGASVALNITYITTFVFQEFYVLVYKRAVFDHYRAPLFEEESFCDWPLFIKLAIPTTGLMCIEWWAFEFIIIFAGILGV